MDDYICVPRWLVMLLFYALAMGGLFTVAWSVYSAVANKLRSRS